MKDFKLLKSPAAKRVRIAKDALEWLKAGKLKATQGTYLIVRAAQPDPDGYMPAVYDASNVNGNSCEACALGACFAVAVEFDRKLAPVDCYGQRHVRTNSEIMRDRLSPLFSLEQLALIECAFEQTTGFRNVTAMADYAEGTPAIKATVDFAEAKRASEKYKGSDAHIMRCIMKNIIRNHGTFVV